VQCLTIMLYPIFTFDWFGISLKSYALFFYLAVYW
jgi:hypothetical protein